MTSDSETHAEDSARALTVDPSLDPLVTAVSLDFRTKIHEVIAWTQLRAEMAAGKFCWVDVDVTDVAEARRLPGKLDLCEASIVEDALTREPATQLARYDDYIHLVLSGCRLVGHKFDLERVDAVFGERFMLTLHRGQPVFLEAVRRALGA